MLSSIKFQELNEVIKVACVFSKGFFWSSNKGVVIDAIIFLGSEDTKIPGDAVYWALSDDEHRFAVLVSGVGFFYELNVIDSGKDGVRESRKVTGIKFSAGAVKDKVASRIFIH